jgi:Arc-like DNA binding domain
MSEQTKRQPGRPSLPEEEKRSRNLTFRSRVDMRDRLSDAASENGRSISEEIESRLEESFRRDEKIADVTASRDAIAAELAELRKQFLDARTENAKMGQRLKDWEERSSFARTMIDALPEHVPEMLRVTALMMVGDPRSGEAARKMFATLAAEKGTLTGTVSAILPASNLSSNTTVVTGILGEEEDVPRVSEKGEGSPLRK